MSNSTFECVQLSVESVQRYVPYSPTSRSQNPIYVPGDSDSRPRESILGSTDVQRRVQNSRNHTQPCPSPHSGCPIAHVATVNHVQVCPTLHSESPTLRCRESNVTFVAVQRHVRGTQFTFQRNADTCRPDAIHVSPERDSRFGTPARHVAAHDRAPP